VCACVLNYWVEMFFSLPKIQKVLCTCFWAARF